MAFWNREAQKHVEAKTEAPKAMESGVKREKPNFDALAKQRVEAFQQKGESRWSKCFRSFRTRMGAYHAKTIRNNWFQ
jgi:hypothetical protein